MVDVVASGTPAARVNSPTLVIAGASLGTLFEWYDFFLYGSLAVTLAPHFSGGDERTAFMFILGAFAAGFIARPFGAVVFGRIGDLLGRKNTFLVTMTIMGLSTFLVGLLPGYDVIGPVAPVLLVALRLLQGLAIGGEYGGAAIFVAEHAPKDRRALHTSWINMMATGGLVTSLLVIIAIRLSISKDDFQAWGWRAPFLLSFVLLGISLWVRMKLGESPVFAQMKLDDTVSKAPLSEAFGKWGNLKLILIALFGTVVGSTTIWYTAQFYALFFLQRVLKVGDLQTYALMATALAIAAPSFLFFGWLSDRYGRKPLMIAGCVLAAMTIFPVFHLLTTAANPALAAAQSTARVVVFADPAACSVQFDPLGANRFDASDCDIAKSFLARAGVSYRSADLASGLGAQVHVGELIVAAPDPRPLTAAGRKGKIAAFETQMKAALSSVGYPSAADPAAVNAPLVIAVVAFLVVLAAMVYAPTAAFLVELFPARIRYTSLSFPYHLGSGWIGGLLPVTAFAIVAANGDVFSGLWYPVFFCTLATVIGVLFLPETRGRTIA
jgi:MFS family permease